MLARAAAGLGVGVTAVTGLGLLGVILAGPVFMVAGMAAALLVVTGT